MRWNLIQTKALAALLVCLIVGVVGIVALMNYSFATNSSALASESVSSAERLFGILTAREVSKMTAVSETLMADPAVSKALADRDRDRLKALTAPLYSGFKKEGITNWMFHSSEPDMTVFLRLHNPASFGDHLNRFIDKEVVRTHAMVVGNELAKAGFALRILRPVYGPHGEVVGYVEFGEELGQFIRTMKSETGDDYGLLLSKKYVDRNFWAASNAVLKRRDNWDDNPGFVVEEKTTPTDSIFRFGGDLSAVPVNGQVLEQFCEGNSFFVRGIFPIHDAAGSTVGAMFIVRDISATYAAMSRTRNILVLLTVASLALGALLVSTLLNHLIFRRLKQIIQVATRVVGGDYVTAIPIGSDDEVGQLETLLEQFRRVFVDLLSHVPELQEQ